MVPPPLYWPMDDPSLAPLVREVAKRELGEDDETREHALAQLRYWVVKNPNIRNCRTDDLFLLAFLRTKKFSVHKAQELLLHFLGACRIIPKMMVNLDILDPKIEILFAKSHLYISPFRDARGRTVTIHSPGKISPSEHSYIDYGRSLIVLLLTMIDDPVAQVMGHVNIYDLANMRLAHATFWSPVELPEVLKAITRQVLPIRSKEIHIINLNPVLRAWFNMLLYANTKKMQDRVYMHHSLEDLHKKVSPELLPKEYGGKMPMEEMVALSKQRMIKHREIVMGMAGMGLLGDKEGDTQVEMGSFRKLNID